MEIVLHANVAQKNERKDVFTNNHVIYVGSIFQEKIRAQLKAINNSGKSSNWIIDKPNLNSLAWPFNHDWERVWIIGNKKEIF